VEIFTIVVHDEPNAVPFRLYDNIAAFVKDRFDEIFDDLVQVVELIVTVTFGGFQRFDGFARSDLHKSSTHAQ
jgi:hypothetical protein